MWSFEHSVVAPVTREQVWAVWSDIPAWPTWDDGVAWVRPDGPFAAGSTYTLKPKQGPAATAVIVRCDFPDGFTDETRLPLCTLIFDHRAEAVSGGVRVTHRVTIRGPLTFLFRRVIGRAVAAGLPGAVSKLVAAAAPAVRAA